MSVATTKTFSGPYLADGVVTAFPFDFQALDPEDVGVLVRDVAGSESVYDPDYFSVSLSEEGGTVTLQFAPAEGLAVYVYSDPSFLQTIKFENGSNWLAEPVNIANDRAAVRALALKREVEQSIRAPLGEALGKLPPAAVRAGGVIKFNDDTGAIEVKPEAEFAPGPAGPASNTRLSLSELKAAPITDRTSLYDGALWTWTAGDFTGKADNASVVQSDNIQITEGAWVRQQAGAVTYTAPLADAITIPAAVKLNDTVSLSSFRYASDPADDWAPTLQRGVDALADEGGGTLLIPPGVFPVKLRLASNGLGVTAVEMKSGVYLQGASKTGSIIRLADNQIGVGTYLRIICSLVPISNVGISNLTIDGNRDGQNIWKEQGNGGNIVLGTVYDCTIRDVISINANGQGIQVAAAPPLVSQRVSIRNCTAKNMSGSTLNADGTVNALYNGNGIGIQVSRAGSVNISNNMVTNCRDNGIDTFSDNLINDPIGGSHIISGNNISLCRTGIFPETPAAVLVTANYIVDCVEGGIFANRINGAPQTVRIFNNMVGNVPVGIRVTGDCLPASGVTIADNTIYSITAPSGFGIQLGLPGANVSYIDVSRNTFAIAAENVPMIGITAAQAAFIRGTDNHYFGAPNPGYFVFSDVTTAVEVTIAGFIGVSDSSVADLDRKWARLKRLEVPDLAGFFGAVPVGQQALEPAASDPATTQALANSLRTALINLGLGV